MQKTKIIALNFVPVLVMISLIPVIMNDLILAALYLLVIFAALAIHHQRNDLILLIFGVVVMTISESIFISTGVETFDRRSLLGIMPIWLPLLWGYAFVAIKRAVLVL